MMLCSKGFLTVPKNFFDHNPHYGGLPSILSTSLIPRVLFTTLRAGHRLVAQFPRIASRIVPVVRTITMLATTRANILKPNRSTTAITQHFSLSVSFYIGILQAKLEIASKI